MADQNPKQTFENHPQPVTHLYPILAFEVGALALAIVAYVQAGEKLADIMLATTILVMVVVTSLVMLRARFYALTVQDRIIRLEMRLRLKELLPEDLQPRINDLELGQLIALRFASDEELPDLTRKVLDENIQDRAAIKKQIKNWQADYHRV